MTGKVEPLKNYGFTQDSGKVPGRVGHSSFKQECNDSSSSLEDGMGKQREDMQVTKQLPEGYCMPSR